MVFSTNDDLLELLPSIGDVVDIDTIAPYHAMAAKDIGREIKKEVEACEPYFRYTEYDYEKLQVAQMKRAACLCVLVKYLFPRIIAEKRPENEVNTNNEIADSMSEISSPKSTASTETIADKQYALFQVAANNTSKQSNIFSTQNHTTATYIRNYNCWANGMNLTGCSPWNSQGANTYAGTAITKRHILIAEHFPGESIALGTVFRFVKSDGTVVSRTITGRSNVGVPNSVDNYTSDLTVLRLDSDLPDGIAIYQILYDNWKVAFPKLIDNTQGLGGFWLDQEEKALPILVSIVNSGHNNKYNAFCQAYGESPFGELLISGDSGNPLFMWPHNGSMPILLSLATNGAAGQGPWIKDNESEIEQAIIVADNEAGSLTNYHLTHFDLSDWIATAKQSDETKTENIKKTYINPIDYNNVIKVYKTLYQQEMTAVINEGIQYEFSYGIRRINRRGIAELQRQRK